MDNKKIVKLASDLNAAIIMADLPINVANKFTKILDEIRIEALNITDVSKRDGLQREPSVCQHFNIFYRYDLEKHACVDCRKVLD